MAMAISLDVKLREATCSEAKGGQRSLREQEGYSRGSKGTNGGDALFRPGFVEHRLRI